MRLRSFVNGSYRSNSNGETFDVINPATSKVVHHAEIANESIQQLAITSAQRGFLQWSTMTGIARSRILQRAATLLRERNDELAAIEVEDTGKPWQEASTVDVVTGADAIEFFAGLAPVIEGNHQSLGGTFTTLDENLWGFVLESGLGIIRCKLPAGNQHRHWPAATA